MKQYDLVDLRYAIDMNRVDGRVDDQKLALVQRRIGPTPTRGSDKQMVISARLDKVRHRSQLIHAGHFGNRRIHEQFAVMQAQHGGARWHHHAAGEPQRWPPNLPHTITQGFHTVRLAEAGAGEATCVLHAS